MVVVISFNLKTQLHVDYAGLYLRLNYRFKYREPKGRAYIPYIKLLSGFSLNNHHVYYVVKLKINL